jgi:integrase
LTLELFLDAQQRPQQSQHYWRIAITSLSAGIHCVSPGLLSVPHPWRNPIHAAGSDRSTLGGIGLVFVSPGGTALDPANLLKAFKHHLKDAGLPDMRFHGLRHSAASMTLANGLPLNVVSDILGHSLTSTTVDIYAHVAPAARREAATAMDRLPG